MMSLGIPTMGTVGTERMLNIPEAALTVPT